MATRRYTSLILERFETVLRTLTRRAVHAHIGHAVQPELPLVIEVRIVEERAAVDKIAAQVPRGPLDLVPLVSARYGRQAREVKPQ